jgi:hypothetical protein
VVATHGTAILHWTNIVALSEMAVILLEQLVILLKQVVSLLDLVVVAVALVLAPQGVTALLACATDEGENRVAVSVMAELDWSAVDEDENVAADVARVLFGAEVQWLVVHVHEDVRRAALVFLSEQNSSVVTLGLEGLLCLIVGKIELAARANLAAQLMSAATN